MWTLENVTSDLDKFVSVVVDFELADIKVFEELGVFLDQNVQGYSNRRPKNTKPTKQAIWCKRNLHGIVWNSGGLDYRQLSKFFSRE